MNAPPPTQIPHGSRHIGTDDSDFDYYYSRFTCDSESAVDLYVYNVYCYINTTTRVYQYVPTITRQKELTEDELIHIVKTDAGIY
jgi:hypothetical protein